MIEDVKQKIDLLIKEISNFNENQVIYILVESYKIAERKWRDQFKRQIPHVVFFRNWVVHTEMDRKSELTIADVISGNNLKTKQLQEEILSILENDKSKEKLLSSWGSFEKNLMAVLANQPVLLNQKVEIVEIPEHSGQFSIQIQ